MLRDDARRVVYAIAVALVRVRAIILERERGAAWLAHLPRSRSGWRCMSDFLAMGGYGFYVWSAYGVTALAIVVEVAALRARRRARARRAAPSRHDALATTGDAR